MIPKAKQFIDVLGTLSREQRDRISQDNVESAQAEHKTFLQFFARDECYLCKHPLASFHSVDPCLHWLLKPKGFKKKHLPAVAEKYAFFVMQTYLRWVANTEGFAKHINDLQDEWAANKISQVTIRFKYLEWSFSCTRSDFEGHASSKIANKPHYHMQIRLSGKPFVDYNEFHFPLHEQDIIGIEAQRHIPNIYKRAYVGGEGMAELLDERIVQQLVESHTTSDSATDGAPLSFDTVVTADDGHTINGAEFYAIVEEAKAKNVPVSSLVHKISHASAKTLVSPGPGVVAPAPRTPLRGGGKAD